MARGGRRSGAPGTAYGNRTDLNVPTASPAMSPNAKPVYGAGTAVAADKAAVPMATPTPPNAPVRPVAGPPVPPPGSMGGLGAPTDNPNEPLTAGLPSGPGAGPGALSISQGAQPELQRLKVHIPYLEAAAQSPDTPQSIITFLKYLKGIG